MSGKSIMAAIALAVGIAAFGTGSAVAAYGASEAGDGGKSAKTDRSRRVCRSIVLSGTRMATRYCRTQEEWDRSSDKSRDFLLEGQMKNARRDGEFNGMDRVQ
jgi:hypothetical protein